MAAESVCAKRLRYGEKTPTQKVLPARTWHMRTDFARLASLYQCRFGLRPQAPQRNAP